MKLSRQPTDCSISVLAPGSGEVEQNDWSNLPRLGNGDELKIVIAHRQDYEWARTVVADRDVPAATPVHFSPVFGELDPQELASWIIEDRLTARLQLQQHKYIWDPKARGV